MIVIGLGFGILNLLYPENSLFENITLITEEARAVPSQNASAERTVLTGNAPKIYVTVFLVGLGSVFTGLGFGFSKSIKTKKIDEKDKTRS